MKFSSVLVIILILFSAENYSQSLGSDRVTHIKNSIVRILVNGNPSGTGFLITEQAHVITCFHVIEEAAIQNKPIQIEFSTGEKVEALYLTSMVQTGLREAVGYDYCVLVPSKPTVKKAYLTLGLYESVSEGDELITMGFPFGISQPVISKGILSTKWKQKNAFLINGKPDSLEREVAWLDMTMNKGNSGGPIIKIGSSPQDDRVIGIATFILNPFANPAQQLVNIYANPRSDVLLGGVSTNAVNKLFANAIANNSIGVSGCISIDHIVKFLNTPQK